jgi:ADP-ribose pyrophosphatase YjhB (NUDIX family)
MIKTLAGKIWWKVPYYFRLKAIRSVQRKFTVSVAAVVTNEKEEVLILDHFFRPRFSWGLPGGFLDPEETPEHGVRRELLEEANLELEDVQLINVRNVGKHIEILFRATGTGNVKVNSNEIRAVGWFPLDKLPEMSEVQIHFLNEVLGR